MIFIKSPEEIVKIREACKIVSRVLKDIEKEIRVGITTEEIDAIAEKIIISYNGRPAFKGYRGYRHATCISVNSVIVHGIPSSLKLKEGDLVGFDVGVVFNGYYGDAARTFAVGEISPIAQKLIDYTRDSLDLAIKKGIEGNFVGDISSAVETKATEGGFSVVKDLFGHGVGRELHEDPLIPNYGEPKSGARLKAGMVLAIEPMLNVGGSGIKTLRDGWTVVTEDWSLSAHFEDTIAITKGKPEILTRI